MEIVGVKEGAAGKQWERRTGGPEVVAVEGVEEGVEGVEEVAEVAEVLEVAGLGWWVQVRCG